MKPIINRILFDRQFELFKQHVIDQSGCDFQSFSSNPYTEQQEGYKYEIYRAGRKILGAEKWREAEIGSGKIARATIQAIEIPENNLVPWQPRYGLEKRPHNALYLAISKAGRAQICEKAIFDLYNGVAPQNAFDRVVELFGGKYPLLAYLFFLKDRSRYMPIAPSYLDKAFERLGIDLVTTRKCSWNNYLTYNNALFEIKAILAEYLDSDVSLLDAHSFAWMLATAVPATGADAGLKNLSGKDREAMTKARIGQGPFRTALIEYWSGCAVTGCKDRNLVVASHVKPWALSTVQEAIDPYNGILLSPSLDRAFDAGYISFTDTGAIMISESLNQSDAKALSIDHSLKLSRVDPRHKPYLAYHRKNVFKQ